MAGETNKIVGSFIAVLIGVVLAPIIFSTATAANVTGTTATVLALVPVLFTVGVLVAAVKGML